MSDSKEIRMFQSPPLREGAKTLFDKIWEKHAIKQIEGGPSVLYIDKHFIHEVTSPQAFAGLNKRGIKVFRPSQTVATADHNVPTVNQHLPIKEELSRRQVEALKQNCAEHGIEFQLMAHLELLPLELVQVKLRWCWPRNVYCRQSQS